MKKLTVKEKDAVCFAIIFLVVGIFFSYGINADRPLAKTITQQLEK